MKSLTTVIIEDEKPAARLLKHMVEALHIEVLTMLHSVKEAIEWFSNHQHPDILFLDIQLSDGISFDIFEEVTTDSAIIFTTAYDQYALQAFKLKSVDYLLKPIAPDELKEAVDKFRSHFEQQQTAVNLQDLKNLLVMNTDAHKYKERFSIKVGQHLKVVPIENVQCVFSENKGTYINTNEGRNYLLEHTLEKIGEDLNPSAFYRVNRKAFVQVSGIKDIISYTNSRLEIKLQYPFEDQIIVSRERVKGFKEWLDK